MAAALAAGPSSAAVPPDAWLPSGAQRFSVAEALEVNGVPMQIHGFVVRRSIDEVVRELKRRLPAPVADEVVASRRVLSRVEGEHLLTLKLEATAGAGTRGLWSATPLRAALSLDGQTLQREALQDLPGGASLRQSLRSRDADRHAHTVMAHHPHSPDAVAEHLLTRFNAEGLELLQQQDDQGRGAVLMWRGAGQAVTAVLIREPRGGTGIVVTRETRQAPVSDSRAGAMR